jgi:thymidylate kinase
MFDQVTTNIYALMDRIQTSNVVIVEGFEFVGKSHVIELITDHLEVDLHKKVVTYRPNYEELSYDSILERSDRYILGLPAIEMFKIMKDDSSVLVLDRSVFSSYVYSIYYNSIDPSKMIQVMDVYRNILKDFKVSVIQVTPYTEDSSKLLYVQALKDDDHKDKYDKFESFDEYYKMLNNMEYLFSESYKAYKSDMLSDDIEFIKYYNQVEA